MLLWFGGWSTEWRRKVTGFVYVLYVVMFRTSAGLDLIFKTPDVAGRSVCRFLFMQCSQQDAGAGTRLARSPALAYDVTEEVSGDKI